MNLTEANKIARFYKFLADSSESYIQFVLWIFFQTWWGCSLAQDLRRLIMVIQDD